MVYSCKYHVVWCPKYRCPVLIEGIDTRLKAILQQVADERRAEIEVMPDPVHVLVAGDPQYGIHLLAKQMKVRSSRLLGQEFAWLRSRLPSLWTNAYFVSTVWVAPLAVVKQYIENPQNG